jgi:hypothetical protein
VKLATLKARAETTKANIELKAIAELLPKKQVIQQKLQEGETDWSEREPISARESQTLRSR